MRLFLAINIPDEVKAELYDLQNLSSHITWQTWEQLHLTLHFLGNTSPNDQTLLVERLRSLKCPSFPISIGGCGHFGSGSHPTSLWTGVKFSLELQQLYKQVGKLVREVGLPTSRRDYKPHITLARLPRKGVLRGTGEFLVQNSLYRGPIMKVSSLALFSSEPTSQGSRYTILETFEFHSN